MFSYELVEDGVSKCNIYIILLLTSSGGFNSCYAAIHPPVICKYYRVYSTVRLIE